jgi:hypothetical protein
MFTYTAFGSCFSRFSWAIEMVAAILFRSGHSRSRMTRSLTWS